MSFGRIKRRPADIKFSQYLRKKRNYTCEYCGARHDPKSKNLGVSHFHSRSHESTRFTENNCHVFCNIPCHQYFETHRTEYEAWTKNRLGEEAYKQLMVAANTYQKKDDAKVLLFLKHIQNHEKTSEKSKRKP